MQTSSDTTCALHVCDKLSTDGSTIHGGARLLMWTLPRLGAHGYRAPLACIRARDPAAERMEAAGVSMHYLASRRFDGRVVFKLLNLIGRENAKILHLHGYASSNFGRMAAALARIPVIVHEHFIDENIPSYQSCADWLMRRRTTVGIGVSQAVTRFMEERRYVPGNRLLTLAGGVPLADFRRCQANELAEVQRDLGVNRSQLIVGAVGRLAAVKGHRVLIEAWPRIHAACPRAILVIVGDGPERHALEDLVRANNIGSSVIFAGHRDNVAQMLSLFNVFCMPSYSEGFGMALIEAMAVRIPVVASEVGGMRELLTNEKDSLLVPAGNSQALAEAVTRLLSDEQLAERLVENGTRTVSHFDIDKFARSLAHLYDTLRQTHEPQTDWRHFSFDERKQTDISRMEQIRE